MIKNPVLQQYNVDELYNGNIGMELKMVLAPLRRTACVAGGALRDLKHGLVPNDYDVICIREFNPVGVANQYAQRYGNKFKVLQKHDDMYKGHEIRSVWKCTLYDNIHIDIIQQMESQKDMMGVVRQFDFSINCIVADAIDLIDMSPLEGDTVRIFNHNNLSWERLGRFKQMFPQYNWNLVEEYMEDNVPIKVDNPLGGVINIKAPKEPDLWADFKLRHAGAFGMRPVGWEEIIKNFDGFKQGELGGIW